LAAVRDSVLRISLDTRDHTDVLVTTLNDLGNNNIIAGLDVDVALSQLFFSDLQHGTIRLHLA